MVRQILVPIDFSECTDAVVAWACGLAEALQARLWLVHVAAPDPDFVGYDAGPPGVRDQMAEHLRDDHREIQRIAGEVRDRGIDATALHVQGPTVETLLRESRKLEVDLIVMGSHGHGALYRTLMGSISEGVMRNADVPVAIVPARRDA